MSGRWADRPLAPRCSTKSPQIPHGSRLLFSIWATLRCRPTPAPAVRLKLYSSDGPDPARAPRTGSIRTSVSKASVFDTVPDGIGGLHQTVLVLAPMSLGETEECVENSGFRHRPAVSKT